MKSISPSTGRPSDYANDEFNFTEFIDRLREFSHFVWRERSYIWRSLAMTVPIGFLFAFGSTPEYSASTKVLPYRSGSSTSGLSGLAGLAGIRLPSGIPEQTITADLYPEVANTLDFRIAVAETPIRFISLPAPLSTIAYFQSYYKPSLLDLIGRYTIGLPSRIVSIFRDAPKLPSARDTVGGRAPLPYYDIEYLRILNNLERRLTVSIDRKTAVITIAGSMPDAYASADLVKAASERLMERIINFEARKASEQLRFIEEEHGRSRVRFEQVQRDLASFTDRNRGTLSASAQIEAQRLQSEYNLRFEVYRQFSTELEQARIKQNQDTPVFTVLEQVVVPNSRTRPRRVLNLLLASFFGLLMGVSAIAWRRMRTTRATTS